MALAQREARGRRVSTWKSDYYHYSGAARKRKTAKPSTSPPRAAVSWRGVSRERERARNLASSTLALVMTPVPIGAWKSHVAIVLHRRGRRRRPRCLSRRLL